ncbi:unnamed protein product [Acanthoscelides obtectus]|uniref:Ninjurin-1-like n=1 Tax=Acanthoscelides obtectus TaxID=200917 RepID=A0A9P0PF21_ACAOB|nr:unnamed protein product [Acanthoscelides obtectus]CAK1660436.1 Ninjurin-1 [Acanthoscelides obtectus]
MATSKTQVFLTKQMDLQKLLCEEKVSSCIPVQRPMVVVRKLSRSQPILMLLRRQLLKMMDIALITANANQLRYVLEYTRHTSTFYALVFLITISLVLQVAIGCALIFKGRLDIKGESKCKRAQTINNCVVSSVFLVTIINVFIASFTITGNNMQKK